MTTQYFNLQDFNRIKIEGPCSVNVTKSDTFSVNIAASDAGRIRVDKQGDTLIVGRRGIDFMSLFRGQSEVTITLPELKEITFSGASHGTLQEFQSDHDLSLKLSGASHLEMHRISCANLRLEISGASNLVGEANIAGDVNMRISGASRVDLSGSGEEAKIELSGASQARLSNFTLNSADVHISGASSAYLKVNQTLDLDLSGASRLEYTGNPVTGKLRVGGASIITHK